MAQVELPLMKLHKRVLADLLGRGVTQSDSRTKLVGFILQGYKPKSTRESSFSSGIASLTLSEHGHGFLNCLPDLVRPIEPTIVLTLDFHTTEVRYPLRVVL